MLAHCFRGVDFFRGGKHVNRDSCHIEKEVRYFYVLTN